MEVWKIIEKVLKWYMKLVVTMFAVAGAIVFGSASRDYSCASADFYCANNPDFVANHPMWCANLKNVR